MMNTIWHQAYPEGIPKEIDPSQFESLNDMFTQCFVRQFFSGNFY